MTNGSAVCCISTYNRLHFALALARSIRARWSEQPAIFVLLADHLDLPRPGFEAVGDVHVLPLDAMAIPGLDWVALKYNAFELTCACKPFLVRYLLGQGFDVVWYVDTDVFFLADPATMRERAARHDFVVTPHLFSPVPAESAWQRPTMGHLSGAGVLNAGLFTARRGEAALRFLGQWGEMTIAAAACLPEVGNHQEQHAFNWITAFAEDVHVLRDLQTNVAYWNLHERPLRWAGLDGGPPDQWLLDGEPIHCFHFSGLRWEERRLSHHDERHSLDLNANIHALAAHYDEQLAAAGRSHYHEVEYGFARAGELEISEELRYYLKRLEARESPPLAAGTATALVDRLLSLPGNCSLLPKVLEDVLQRRAPLRALDQKETLFPHRFLDWCLRFFEPEYGTRLPLFRSSLVAVHVAERTALARRCAHFLPGVSTDWIAGALVHGRAELKSQLLQRKLTLPNAGEIEALIDRIESGHHLVLAFNPAMALRAMTLKWPRLFRSVPPLGSGDATALRESVSRVLADNFLWPRAHQDFPDQVDPEASLVRVLSVVRRHPHLLSRLRREGLSRAVLRSLVPHVSGDGEVDACDLALLDWHLESAAPSPAQTSRATAPRLLRLFSPKHRAAVPCTSDDLAGIAPARLLPLLVDEENPRGWAGYLDWWFARNAPEGATPAGSGHAPPALSACVASGSWRALGELSPSLAPEPRGLNLFGYFKSPIGLGQMSRGVAAALAVNGQPYREIVLTNMTMSPALRLEDLYPDFGYHFPRNLAVTYPHINYDLAEIFPPSFFRGRETIGYLAWEQRDLHPAWCKRLERYDRLFALSRFTAEAVCRATGRDCDALPCVVEVDVERARACRRADFGLPEEGFVAGMMFDATSSIKRKNPMAAARALVRAFRGRPDVTVVVKVNSGDRLPYRRAVAELTALLASSGIRHHLITHLMPRHEVDGLMAQLDLYVSLHRCEGFGYSIAEAMWLGVPVVATAYSGNMDFMHEGNSFPVRCREVVIRENEGPFQLGTVWAEPDVEHAAALCDQIYSDRHGARAKTAQAERDVRATLSVEAVATRLRELLG